ncbi:MAG: PssD/Cps14F family polysaccharide biosynthesis glycosyltransferase [Phycisphaerales bacterium]
MKNNRKMKICLAASAGGHLTQLLKLAQSWHEYEVFFITTCNEVKNKLEKKANVYVVGESNRQHPLKIIKTIIFCMKIIINEKPNVIISTGAAVGCIACLLGKLSGAKVIWVDSITNIERLSLSGRLVRPVANLFIAQWQQLAQRYTNVIFEGTLI